MDETIRADQTVSHFVQVQKGVEEAVSLYPEDRKSEQRKGCRELKLHLPPQFDKRGCDGESEIELVMHRYPVLGGQATPHDQRCSDPSVLVTLTRTAITVNGPARSVEKYRITILRAFSDGKLMIDRETVTKTEGLPTAARRYAESEERVRERIVETTHRDIAEATEEILKILSAHKPS